MKRIRSTLNASLLILTLISTSVLFGSTAQAQTPVAPQFTVIDVTPSGQNGSLQSIDLGQRVGSIGGFPGGVVAPANHAFLWSDTAVDPIDLHPSFLDFPALNAAGNSFALATDGGTQVGYGVGAATNQRNIALRWSGTADTAEVLLPPFNYIHARAQGTCNGQTVGYAVTAVPVNGRGSIRFAGGPWHAVLWNAGTTTGIDLNNGAEATVATACDGGRQVGYGGKMDISGNVVENKAMMWFGNRNTFVWLHPNGYVTSQAVAINGPYQAGHAEIQFLQNNKPAFNSRAVLWMGSAASVIELALPPAGIFNFFATGVTSNGQAVGYGIDVLSNRSHALYWPSPTAPAVDLNQFLSADYSSAYASGIDASGRIVGTAFVGNVPHAVMWAPAP
jgi:hypothetical protein